MWAYPSDAARLSVANIGTLSSNPHHPPPLPRVEAPENIAMPDIKRLRESGGSPKTPTGLSPLRKKARTKMESAARESVAPEDRVVEHVLSALRVINSTMPPSGRSITVRVSRVELTPRCTGILPVAVKREGWPDLAKFDTQR